MKRENSFLTNRQTKTLNPLAAVLAAASLTLTGLTAHGQAPVIGSFSENGVLICSNLVPGSFATVEWAPSVTGLWTKSWAGLEAVAADSNGVIGVSVAMFYRVRAVPPPGMVLITNGLFTMGDTFSDGYSDERPAHTVYVSDFYMDRYVVTKALWDEVYQWAITNGYSFETDALGKALSHPAYHMTWYMAVKWCNARSEKEGRVPAYYGEAAQTNVYRTGTTDVQNDWVKWTAGYRLPTEAEWEKAARGGASGHRFPWSDVDTITHSRANYYSDASYAYDISPTRGYHPDYDEGGHPYTSPVGSFAANGYGLCDMAGNVWEWCWDWYDGSYYSSSPSTDPRGPAGPLSYRVLRGGGCIYYSSAPYTRCAHRQYYYPDNAYYSFGFRCVRGF